VVNISLFWTKHPTSALIGEEVEGATFELMDNRRRQDIDAFDVGFDTGEVVTAQQLEYSVQSLYKIPVVATARGVSRLVRLEVSVLEPGDLAGGSGGGGSSAGAAVGAAIALILLLLLLAGVMVRRKREKQALDAADGKALEAQLPGRQFSQGKYLDPGDEALGSGMISTELGAPAAQSTDVDYNLAQFKASDQEYRETDGANNVDPNIYGLAARTSSDQGEQVYDHAGSNQPQSEYEKGSASHDSVLYDNKVSVDRGAPSTRYNAGNVMDSSSATYEQAANIGFNASTTDYSVGNISNAPDASYEPASQLNFRSSATNYNIGNAIGSSPRATYDVGNMRDSSGSQVYDAATVFGKSQPPNGSQVTYDVGNMANMRDSSGSQVYDAATVFGKNQSSGPQYSLGNVEESSREAHYDAGTSEVVILETKDLTGGRALYEAAAAFDTDTTYALGSASTVDDAVYAVGNAATLKKDAEYSIGNANLAHAPDNVARNLHTLRKGEALSEQVNYAVASPANQYEAASVHGALSSPDYTVATSDGALVSVSPDYAAATQDGGVIKPEAAYSAPAQYTEASPDNSGAFLDAGVLRPDATYSAASPDVGENQFVPENGSLRLRSVRRTNPLYHNAARASVLGRAGIEEEDEV